MSQVIPAPEGHALHIVRPYLSTKLGLPESHPWQVAARMLTTGEGATPSGTLKAWAAAHNGQRIDTLQVQPRSEWRPGPRTLAAHPTYATLDGSRQDFKGCRVLHATPSMIVFTYDWGGPAYVVWSVAD